MINSILKDVREENKTVWIVSQNMAKVFDSVEMFPLQKALERIKLPPTTINFIINIYKDQKIRIITAYGLTDAFTVRDGKIALIADEFFDINDIKINGGKSEVIVVNLEDNNENERFIEIGKNRNKVTANKSSVSI
ncbi:unnamed protein product [Rhizophagus irregularis]|nr:unnamed protein product [Rhizophagus irregularis]